MHKLSMNRQEMQVMRLSNLKLGLLHVRSSPVDADPNSCNRPHARLRGAERLTDVLLRTLLQKSFTVVPFELHAKRLKGIRDTASVPQKQPLPNNLDQKLYRGSEADIGPVSARCQAKLGFRVKQWLNNG
jgi:hypothetical protein